MGEAADGAEAIALARELRPDVVCMDIRMPGTDGIAATRAIVSDPDLDVDVLILTTFDVDDDVLASLEAGAAGFLLKGADEDTPRSGPLCCGRGGNLGPARHPPDPA